MCNGSIASAANGQITNQCSINLFKVTQPKPIIQSGGRGRRRGVVTISFEAVPDSIAVPLIVSPKLEKCGSFVAGASRQR